VNVYLRNSKKEARLVPLQTPAKSTDLTIIASTRFNIPETRVILFYNGFRIDNYGLPINLAERGIMHILDKRNLEVTSISAIFRPVGWNVPTFKFTLSADMTVQEVMASQLAVKYNV
jgi:hypothetical protein